MLKELKNKFFLKFAFLSYKLELHSKSLGIICISVYNINIIIH